MGKVNFLVISVLAALVFTTGYSGNIKPLPHEASKQTEISTHQDQTQSRPGTIATFQIDSDMCHINGKAIKMGAPAIMLHHHYIYLPLDYLTQALEIPASNIKWDDSQQKVVLQKNATIVKLELDSSEMLINGKRTDPLVVKMIFRHETNGRIYIEARQAAHAFGYNVLWNDSTRQMNIIAGFPIADEDFSIGRLKLGMNENQVFDILGAPADISYNHCDDAVKSVSYPEQTMAFYKQGTTWILSEFYCESPQYLTHRGIKVGDGLEKIFDTYGQSYNKYERGDSIVYSYILLKSIDWERELSFHIIDNKVTLIYMLDRNHSIK